MKEHPTPETLCNCAPMYVTCVNVGSAQTDQRWILEQKRKHPTATNIDHFYHQERL